MQTYIPHLTDLVLSPAEMAALPDDLRTELGGMFHVELRTGNIRWKTISAALVAQVASALESRANVEHFRSLIAC